jgi:DNA-binding MarR family transcriptional regulator
MAPAHAGPLALRDHMMPKLTSDEIRSLPGFLIRRCNQSFTGLFLRETGDIGVTPAQFGALALMAVEPGMDQTQLTDRLALDRSSVAKCMERLEGRGLIRREVDPADRRARRLYVTQAGLEFLDGAEEAVLRAQAAILAPLGPERAALFIAMLKELAAAHNEVSRVPMRGGE